MISINLRNHLAIVFLFSADELAISGIKILEWVFDAAGNDGFYSVFGL